VAALEYSSARLASVAYSISFDEIEAAWASLRLARVRFNSTMADCREMRQTPLLTQQAIPQR
jgi:hypothetical protein